MNIAILGAGAYALALSEMFVRNGNNSITMWTKIQEEYDTLVRERCNKRVLVDYKVNSKVKFTLNIEKAIRGADLIVIAVPVKFARNTIAEFEKFYNKKQHICIACKGIEQDSLSFVSTIVSKTIKTKKIGVISGGTFAIDMTKGVPVALTLASKNVGTSKIIKKTMENDILKVEITKDVFGVEMYGAIKNVIAIASGMIDGLNYPDSTKCMFITKALNDVMNLIYSFGGNKKTILTYAGIGDLLLTCNSSKSRNYTLGKMYGMNLDMKAIHEYINNNTVEGLYTLKAIYNLVLKSGKKVAIIDIIYGIIYRNEDINRLNKYLVK